ncbi:hypothetical protein [Modestobacter sp. Leaf380]|uniref:hypothetical protein n=1 Tax=Modestobacter sp. Leaf380 TaxID=1736356 RepID=UPI0006F3EC48|nr:hypothetical protein [Modestobacter sp. Leaf380]KQS64334.1 hypothetical protein ASG41_16990 [Modestobacter sp. Leaf380]
MTVTSLVLPLAMATVGTVLCPLFVAVGMRQLHGPARTRVRLQVACLVLGCLWGFTTGSISSGAAEWPLRLALVAWGAALIAAAACDAVTQRVPTSLVRTSFLGAGTAIAAALLLHGDVRAVAITAIATAAATLTLLACWRFAGAGFGDVRLAALGGLGLGQVTASGVVLGLAAMVVVTMVQTALVVSRGGDRRTLMPLGPALAVGFLVAAAA